MQLTAEARSVPAVDTFLSARDGCCFFSALRDWYVGSGQKESVSEEALCWESSVFRDGR